MIKIVVNTEGGNLIDNRTYKMHDPVQSLYKPWESATNTNALVPRYVRSTNQVQEVFYYARILAQQL